MNSRNSSKILMLHGHAESGPSFQTKTRRLQTHLTNVLPTLTLSFHTPTAPIRITPYTLTSPCTLNPFVHQKGHQSRLEAYAWGTGDFRGVEEIEGLEGSVDEMLRYMDEEGPFWGIIGFSCGAALGAILAAVVEGRGRGFVVPEGFNHPPLTFLISYSGFTLSSPTYHSIYHPQILTPTLHIIGRLDAMIEEEQALALVKRCRNSKVVYYPGNYYVPMKSEFLGVVGDFIRGLM